MASCCIPIRKPLDLDFLILKIKMNLAPFAVAVYPIPVGCGGIFAFCLFLFFKTQVNNTAGTIFNQLRGQSIQCSMVATFEERYAMVEELMEDDTIVELRKFARKELGKKYGRSGTREPEHA